MDCRGTNIKARTPIKRLFQWPREEVVMKVARKGRFAAYLRVQERELAGDLDRIAEKKARQTPKYATQQLGGLL